MEGHSRKDEFMDLISREREWNIERSEEKKLELRLGPPGEEHWSIINNNKNNNSRERNHESFLSFGYFSDNPCSQNPVLKSPWKQQTTTSHLFHFQSNHPQHCSNRVGGENLKISEKPANTAVPNCQKRTAPAPVVGWPPIRSFRKNLAIGSSSKLGSDSENVVDNKVSDSKTKENCTKTSFVKINMDGIPIGRKVDLKAYDSYEKLSHAVDELFRGLLAAQSDSSVKNDGGKVIGGILDGNREYTFVYEDNEGDRMLVGDVPWDMFVSTVKRLRVLRSSELPMLSRGSKQRKQLPLDK